MICHLERSEGSFATAARIIIPDAEGNFNIKFKATAIQSSPALKELAPKRIFICKAHPFQKEVLIWLETARIKADLINSLYSMHSYGPMKKKLKADGTAYTADDYVQAYEATAKALNQNFADASLMKMTVYRDIADETVKQGGKAEQVQLINDWYKTDALVREMQKHSDKQELSLFVPKVAAIKTPVYSNAAKQILQSLMAFGKNDPAADFTAIIVAVIG